jgi:uncharacterized membrane protein YkvA (DUF1232 family)
VSIRGLLERGIRSVLDEPAGEEELRALLASRQMDADGAEHIRQTLEAMPALLVAMEQALSDPAAPPHARKMFQAVVHYIMTEENLIPSHAGRPLLGLLDDVYLVHVAALELKEQLGRVDMRSVAGGAQLLEQALPPFVTEALRGFVKSARSRRADGESG